MKTSIGARVGMGMMGSFIFGVGVWFLLGGAAYRQIGDPSRRKGEDWEEILDFWLRTSVLLIFGLGMIILAFVID